MLKKYQTKGIDASAIETKKKQNNLLKILREYGFPFKGPFLDPVALMENLRRFEGWSRCENVTPHNVRFHDKSFSLACLVCFHHKDDDYNSMDIIGDAFTEPQRLSALRADAQQTPLEQFEDDEFLLAAVKRVFEEQKESLTPQSLREAVYSMTKEATQFKPSLMVAVVRYLFPERNKPLRILDMSAGWGDRAIASIALGAEEYRGFDPNTSLRQGHDQIFDTFKVDREKFSVTYQGFETAELPDNHFDIMFSSPPFFNFEIYTRDPEIKKGQSVEKFPGLNDWLEGFLFLSMDKIWKAIRIGGYVVVHLTDVGRMQVCESLCKHMVSLGARYVGVLCSIGAAGKPRPLWVFQRMLRS